MGKIQIGRWAPTLSTKMALGHFLASIAQTGSTGITIVGFGSATGGTNGFTASLPSGFQANDILLFEGVWGVYPGIPPGFSPINSYFGFGWRRASGTETDYSTYFDAFNRGAGANCAFGQITAIRGCVTSGSPFDVIDTVKFTDNGDLGGTWSLIPTASITTTGPSMVCLLSFVNGQDFSGFPAFINTPGDFTWTTGSNAGFSLSTYPAYASVAGVSQWFGPKNTAGLVSTSGASYIGLDSAQELLFALKPAAPSPPSMISFTSATFFSQTTCSLSVPSSTQVGDMLFVMLRNALNLPVQSGTSAWQWVGSGSSDLSSNGYNSAYAFVTSLPASVTFDAKWDGGLDGDGAQIYLAQYAIASNIRDASQTNTIDAVASKNYLGVGLISGSSLSTTGSNDLLIHTINGGGITTTGPAVFVSSNFPNTSASLIVWQTGTTTYYTQPIFSAPMTSSGLHPAPFVSYTGTQLGYLGSTADAFIDTIYIRGK
jgi:hypothetical protein